MERERWETSWTEGAETPWATVQRLRTDGASLGEIISALQARGVSRDGVEALLGDDPGFLAWQRAQPEVQPPGDGVRREVPPLDGASLFRWLVVAVSFLAGGLASGAVTRLAGLLTAPLLLLPGLGALVLEARRHGVRRTAWRAGLLLLVTFALPALLGLFSRLDAARAFGLLGFLSGPALMAWALRRKEALPGVRDFSQGALHEEAGVQLTVTHDEAPTRPGGQTTLRVVAQGVVDAPRTLELSVFWLADGRLQRERHAFELVPGTVEELLLPVRVPESATEGHFEFALGVDVWGTSVGRLLRFQHAEPWSRQRRGQTLELALGLFGVHSLPAEARRFRVPVDERAAGSDDARRVERRRVHPSP